MKNHFLQVRLSVLRGTLLYVLYLVVVEAQISPNLVAFLRLVMDGLVEVELCVYSTQVYPLLPRCLPLLLLRFAYHGNPVRLLILFRYPIVPLPSRVPEHFSLLRMLVPDLVEVEGRMMGSPNNLHVLTVRMRSIDGFVHFCEGVYIYGLTLPLPFLLVHVLSNGLQLDRSWFFLRSEFIRVRWIELQLRFYPFYGFYQCWVEGFTSKTSLAGSSWT